LPANLAPGLGSLVRNPMNSDFLIGQDVNLMMKNQWCSQ